MAVDTPAKIAIVGASPIGLEAALYARYLGYEVEIFERRAALESAFWPPDLAMFEPFGACSSSLALRALTAQDSARQFPSPEATLTFGEWYEMYVRPLAESDLIAEFVRYESELVAIGKVEIGKADSPSGEYDRGAWDFRLLVRGSEGKERIAAADVVLDCSGRSLASPLGHGGIPALGETAAAAQGLVRYSTPTLDEPSLAGKSILLVGEDLSAAVAAVRLAPLAAKSGGQLTWFTRHEKAERPGGPFDLSTDGPWSAAQSRLLEQANLLATSGQIAWQPETWVEAVEPTGEGRLLVCTSGESESEATFDIALALGGRRPDWSFCQELQLEICPMSDAPRFPNGWPITTEPNFYVLGSKSFGRRWGYSHSEGLTQVRDLFRVVFDREELDLYRSPFGA
jgi:hypothetical protein